MSASCCEEVKIQASKTTNALVVTAPPSIITSLEKVIAKLDIKRSQVLIEAIIVEVSESFSETRSVVLLSVDAVVVFDELRTTNR